MCQIHRVQDIFHYITIIIKNIIIINIIKRNLSLYSGKMSCALPPVLLCVVLTFLGFLPFRLLHCWHHRVSCPPSSSWQCGDSRPALLVVTLTLLQSSLEQELPQWEWLDLVLELERCLVALLLDMPGKLNTSVHQRGNVVYCYCQRNQFTISWTDMVLASEQLIVF